MAGDGFYDGTQISLIFSSSCEFFVEEMELRLSHIEKQLSEKKGATLILGAGVSQSMGLPSWNTLVARATFLLSNTKDSANMWKIYGPSCARDEKRPTFPEEVLNVFEGTDILETAAYLDILAPVQKAGGSLFSILRTSNRLLAERYKGLIRYCLFPEGDFSVDSYLINNSNPQSNTLIETAKLAAHYFSSCRKDTTTFRNNRSVITYNFDNLFESLLENTCFLSWLPGELRDIKVFPLYDQKVPERVPDGEKHLHIYHPHGYLDLCHSSGDESKSIVLSEESFYELERRNYNWVNFLLARALHDDLCLFIGFSGNDYNFRRIIKNIDDFNNASSMKADDFQHFLIVTVDELVTQVLKMYSLKGKAEDDLLSHNDIRVINDDVKHRILNYLKLKEFYWRRKGFLPIWATIKDVPHIIAGLHGYL